MERKFLAKAFTSTYSLARIQFAKLSIKQKMSYLKVRNAVKALAKYK
jgi:hypothetical protein